MSGMTNWHEMEVLFTNIKINWLRIVQKILYFLIKISHTLKWILQGFAILIPEVWFKMINTLHFIPPKQMIKFCIHNPFSDEHDKTKFIFDNNLHKSINLDDFLHTSCSKSDSGNLYHTPSSSNFQSFNKLPEFFDLPDTDTACESPTSSTYHLSSSLFFQSITGLQWVNSNQKWFTTTTEKNCPSIPSRSGSDKQSISQKINWLKLLNKNLWIYP